MKTTKFVFLISIIWIEVYEMSTVLRSVCVTAQFYIVILQSTQSWLLANLCTVLGFNKHSKQPALHIVTFIAVVKVHIVTFLPSSTHSIRLAAHTHS